MKLDTAEYYFIVGLLNVRPNLTAGAVARILTILRSV